MTAYIVASYTVKDEEKITEYRAQVTPTLTQYGGKVLIVADNPDTGGVPMQHPVVVVLEFESLAAAQRWYASPEYQAIVHLRHAATEGWGFMTEQFQSTES